MKKVVEKQMDLQREREREREREGKKKVSEVKYVWQECRAEIADMHKETLERNENQISVASVNVTFWSQSIWKF